MRALLLLLLLHSATLPAAAQRPDLPGGDSARTSAGWEEAPVLGEAILLGRTAAYAATAPLRWGADDLGRVAMVAGGLALLSLADEAGRDLMRRSRSDGLDRAEDWIEPFGRARGLQAVGALYAAGLLLDDARARATAAEALAAGAVAAGLFQPALAEVIGRPRPRRDLPAHTFRPFSGNISFPSGHTTAAFAAATVIAVEYPHPAVAAGAYGLASAVGIVRMYAGAHFVSDVAAAAVLGGAVGHAAARFGQRRRSRPRVAPVVGADGAYLVVWIPL